METTSSCRENDFANHLTEPKRRRVRPIGRGDLLENLPEFFKVRARDPRRLCEQNEVVEAKDARKRDACLRVAGAIQKRVRELDQAS
jgi:hypothetical protein